MDYFPDNTLTHFTTRLPQMMDLVGSWEIGMTEIQYPHSCYNIKKREAWVHVDVYLEVNQLQGNNFQLTAGYYPSPKRILKAIEGKKHRTPLKKKFDIGMNEINHKIGIAVKKDCHVTTSPLLQHMLGFKRAIFPQGDHVADWVADVTRGLSSLYVYCPLAEPRMVGDAQVPLLRMVLVEGRDAEMVTRIFDPVQYCPLVLRRFQTVEIDIRDDTGVKIPFERGRVVVTLHCRKRKDSYLE
jgi:hypothetical protein